MRREPGVVGLEMGTPTAVGNGVRMDPEVLRNGRRGGSQSCGGEEELWG